MTAPDAVERLAARLPGPAVVVADANTFDALGARVAQTLSAETIVFADRDGLHAGRDEVERVRRALFERGGYPVAVGSGTITDIVRYAAHLADLDFTSVPTAASMDGYASSVAALDYDGVKVTLPARAPTGIFADPGVVAAAPPGLTRAGLGDLLGKATARVDWLAAHLLYGEPFMPAAADRVLRVLDAVLIEPGAALAGDVSAVRALLAGLIESGLAISLVGNSRPASGFEHHASHFWDLLAARGLRPQHPHGLQVGYGTRLAMTLQRFAFGGGVTELRPPDLPEDPLGADARRWLGEPRYEIEAAVEDKRRFVEAAWLRPEDWGGIRATLAPELARFDAVERALDEAGIPARPEQLDLDPEMVRATVHHATRLRARYTVVDFLEGQAMLEAAYQRSCTCSRTSRS